jgi:hypothetical protein
MIGGQWSGGDRAYFIAPLPLRPDRYVPTRVRAHTGL